MKWPIFFKKNDIPQFAEANQKGSSSKLHFLNHLLDESLAMVHIS
jgi:hypothetical protein